jgi:hypothetical protein
VVHYRLYFRNAAGHFMRAIDVEAVDDAAARTAARQLDHAHRIEIWTGTRMVGIVQANERKLTAESQIAAT